MKDPHASTDHGRTTRRSSLVLLTIVLALLGLQYFASVQSTRRSSDVLQELRRLDEKHLTEEKLRQEAISGRIKNEEQSVLLSTLVTNISALIGILVAFTGAWIGLAQFLDVRRKESSERAALEFNKLWEGISQENDSARAASIAGLQVFLGPDYRQFHSRAASALAVCARLEYAGEGTGIVSWTLGPVLQQLVRVSPDEFRRVSWRGSKLRGVDFSAVDLSGVDFRDASLIECNFQKTKLSKARFDAAVLTGCKFDGANLEEACLTYADLAYASVRDANLSRAMLSNIKLLNLEMRGANLLGAKISAHATDWRLAKSWREAKMEAGLTKRLLSKYGPAVSGVRVLMLLWEFPPFVSGGQWTAAYHLLHNLRKNGAHITVFVPSAIGPNSAEIFGSEIEVIGADVLESTSGLGVYDASLSAYRGTGYGAYGGYAGGYGGKGVLEYIQRFVARLPQMIDDSGIQFDLIHAHDWLTFQAAETLASSYGKPWFAHFHSLEDDRTSEPSYFIRTVEKQAAERAAGIVVPSECTRQRLLSLYGIAADRISIVPNCLSDAPRAETNIGYRQSKQVVFSGRLSQQKGPERFVAIAGEFWKKSSQATFLLFGSGSKDELTALRSIEYVSATDMPDPILFPGTLNQSSRLEIQYMAPLFPDGRHGDLFEVQQEPPKAQTNAPEYRQEYEKALEQWKDQRAFMAAVYSRGFTVYALAEPVTGLPYRLELQGELEPGMERNYLISSNSYYKVPRIYKRSVRIIDLKGGLRWEERERAFNDAAVLVVPSRHEPFGMIVLEAMQHGVPALYPKAAGVAEVLHSGIAFDPEDVAFATRQIERLLSEEAYWTRVVETQYEEIDGYAERGYERLLQELWNKAVASPKAHSA